MGTQPESSGAERVADIHQRALPQVYGYLLPRCGSTVVAEDLTAETFMAAVAALAQGRIRPADVTLAWLIGVARHKLAEALYRDLLDFDEELRLQVRDLAATVEELRGKGGSFRNDIVAGTGVRQILIQDPSGNLVELFEPRAAYHERPPRAAG